MTRRAQEKVGNAGVERFIATQPQRPSYSAKLPGTDTAACNALMSAHLRILGKRDVHQHFGSWMHNVEQFHDGCPIIADCHLALHTYMCLCITGSASTCARVRRLELVERKEQVSNDSNDNSNRDCCAPHFVRTMAHEHAHTLSS